MGICMDCGLLAIRNTDFSLGEVKRESSDLHFKVMQWTLQDRQAQPICFIGEINLLFAYNEQQDKHESIIENSVIVNQVLRQCGCDIFRAYKQGFTPKEHREMMDREWMQKHQDEREDVDKKWRAKQEHYLVKMAGIYAIVAGIGGAAIGAIITWLFTSRVLKNS